MRYLTAGESHGKGLTAILDGFPSLVPVDKKEIDAELRRRQLGYGRGGRQKIERDEAEITAGVMGGITLGSPISFFIANRDYESWKAYTDPETGTLDRRALTAVRPGHADLAGMIKYGFSDARPVLERASARETAARVGVGAFCKQLLKAVGITVESHVTKIGGVAALVRTLPQSINAQADADPVRCLDKAASAKMCEKIDQAKQNGDTLGGEAEIVAFGMPAGVGSYTQYDRKLDAILCAQLMSIQSVKSVQVGQGVRLADFSGKAAHDEIFANGKRTERHTNRAGGIEGGMSNGEPIVLRVSFKPIPTLVQGLRTVDVKTGEQTVAAAERSDVCAVPAASVVAENCVAFALADALLSACGGSSLPQIRAAVGALRTRENILP